MDLFTEKSTLELASLAKAGGGFTLNAREIETSDLTIIASAASEGGARVTFRLISGRPAHELETIAKAGNGAVTFE